MSGGRFPRKWGSTLEMMLPTPGTAVWSAMRALRAGPLNDIQEELWATGAGLTIRTLLERGVGNSTGEPMGSQNRTRTRPWSCRMGVALVAEQSYGDAYNYCKLITLSRTKTRLCSRT